MRLKDLRVTTGETVKVTNVWTAEAESRDTTVTSSTWSYTGDGSLSTDALVGMDASVLLTPTTDGVLANTVHLANSEVLIARREVTVE